MSAAWEPSAVLTQYEALRREATEGVPFAVRGYGLALFLRRGLPGWLAALTALPPTPGPPPGVMDAPLDQGPRLMSTARGELTTLLAGMVLACAQAEEAR